MIGAPVSTTHVISTSIMGVGASKRLSAVKWGVVERIVWAWVLTLPLTGLLGYLLVRLGTRLTDRNGRVRRPQCAGPGAASSRWVGVNARRRCSRSDPFPAG